MSLFLTFFTTCMYAGEVIVTTGSPGTYYLKITVAADGSATVSPLSQVYTLGTPPVGPVVPDPVVPVNPTLTARAKAIQAEAAKATSDPNREDTAQALAMLYRELSKQVKVGKVPDAATLQALTKMGADMLLTGKGAAWQPTRDLLSNQWAAVTAQGGKVADYGVLLEEVANGLDASVPNRQIKPETLALILKIIEIIMGLLIK